MGGGGRRFEEERVPHERPPFSLSELRKAIPPHCFRRSLLRSFSYVARDLAAVVCISYAACNYFPLLPSRLSPLAWVAAWALQGFFLVGLWVIAHECGHHAFSEHQRLDDAVGFLIHSALLVPYFSWKISHRLHHANAASLDDDQNFIPDVKADLPPYQLKLLDNPLGRLALLAFSAVAGWPLYLLCNLRGRSYSRPACHFDPFSPMFTARERVLIFASDVGVLISAYGLRTLALARGLPFLFRVYLAPLVVVHGTIVLIIFLHHTHPSLPHYDSAHWDWMRGSLSTVDRDYGVMKYLFHHIGDTHVVHHLFSSLPHYHSAEATLAIKPLLGRYYRFDGTPIFKALWREVANCMYVEADEASRGVFWFGNHKLSRS